MRDPANKKILADGRYRLPVQDHAYWLGDMNPRETGRLLEAIERGTMTSAASAATMRTIMGGSRLTHVGFRSFLDVPVAQRPATAR
ncbi:MAG: hypothetical protein IPP90_23725 [Gemmatimonadaceae bacterium]|nr:hypothetical protein [Gemmatimonadaceae bacterium]